MMELRALTKRNCKLFFKDKGLFFTSMITPLILLVLYATFLARVYKDAFLSAMPEGIALDGRLINAMVGGQLLSSLLAVSCVTVAFCSNMLMVQDKITGAYKDLTMTPVKNTTMALSYFLSTAAATLLICFVALGVGLVYLACIGWYFTVTDVLYLMADVLLLGLFGTALSSAVNCKLSTQGHVSAVGSIVSSCYGFICGAYMPISSFGSGLQKVLSFLPGTYATSLMRNHCMGGVFRQMDAAGLPQQVVESLRDSVDCNIYFFGSKVGIPVMYGVLVASIALTVAIYTVISRRKSK